MNYILILILIIYLLNKKKENFSSDNKCKECRKKGVSERRKKNKKIDPKEIFRECIKKDKCNNIDFCNYCVKNEKGNDKNLVKVIDGYRKTDGYEEDISVDLNKCKKFRYCHDNFEGGICNTDKWRKLGGIKHCCKPCIRKLKKGIDESDESNSVLSKICMNKLKLNDTDEEGVCSRKIYLDYKNIDEKIKRRNVKRRVSKIRKREKRRRKRKQQ